MEETWKLNLPTSGQRKFDIFLRLVVAVILAQTLYFKFSGAPESIYIFSKLEIEPWGRYFSGLVELIAVALLLRSKTSIFGALLSIGTMIGAIGGHLTKLGIVVQGDHGLLFGLACTVLTASLIILYTRQIEIKYLLAKISKDLLHNASK